ncbi:MAG: M67 family metallopeptidase [Acidobacteria bacterium]|nr:M67 family metallopeptidase [Acidobacteriota bacterium]
MTNDIRPVILNAARTSIRMRSRVVADVVRHARETAPAECCGLLLGGDAAIEEAARTRNASDNPSRFVIDPADHIACRRDARDRGLAVLGFYHSHPRSGAVPSATDREEAAYPGHLYLIVSLAADVPDLRLFQLDQGNFRSIPFVTVD